MNKSFVSIIFALYMCGLSASHPLFMNGYSSGSQTNLGLNFITLDDIAEAMIVMPEEKQRKIYQALTELNENLTPHSKIQRFIISIPIVVQQKGNEIQSLQQTLSNNVLSSLLFPTSSALMPNQPLPFDVLSSGPSFHSHTHGDHHHLHKPIKTHGIDLIISTQTHEYKPEKKTKKSKNSSEKLKLDDKDNDDDFFSIFNDILDGFAKENIKPDDAPDKTKTTDTVDDKAGTTVDENLPEGDLKNVDQVADGKKTTETKSDESSISEEETSEATLDQSVDSVKKPDEEKFPNLAEGASEPSPNQSLNSPESTTDIISDQSLNSAEEPLQLIQQDLTFDSAEKATAQTSDVQSTDLQKPVESKQNELEELSDLSSTNLNTTLESSQDKLDETISTESAGQNQTIDSETTDRKIVESQEPIQGDESKTAEAILPQNKSFRRKDSMKGTKPRKSSNKGGAPNSTRKGGRNTSKTKKSGEDTKLQKE